MALLFGVSYNLTALDNIDDRGHVVEEITQLYALFILQVFHDICSLFYLIYLYL